MSILYGIFGYSGFGREVMPLARQMVASGAIRDHKDELVFAVRLARFGRWLRSTSLDELPELLHVLGGDMSFVGPRPLPMDYLPLYSQWQRRRHELRPGITGWAQVKGRNSRSCPEKLRLDVWYVDNWSILLDLRILLLTVVRVVGKGGITGAGQATARKWTGEQN
jgi:lipopolysaccharide/colanic/teichoic acid biosynthesis glycosyltransferase